MKKLLYAALLVALVGSGCAITDYPVITDARGSYNDVIRTGHKAYVVGTSQVATIWPDGSDELFSMVYQAQSGDQKLYTFNNYDPLPATVLFLDQTYCDWRYDGCEIVRAWNPVNSNVDDVFDYESFPGCPGWRSLSLLVSQTSRVGECGDGMFLAQRQAFAAEFANLATTTWRGETAYIIPINASNTSITLNGTSMPIYGQFNAMMTGHNELMFPMTPNARNELRWLSTYASEHGRVADLSVTYNSISADIQIGLVTEGLNYNSNRF